MRKRPWEDPLKLFQRTELSQDWGGLCYQGKDDTELVKAHLLESPTCQPRGAGVFSPTGLP